MSRLDSFIRRIMAQRDYLNGAARLVGDRAGALLEVGLGNGRTYDHLRSLFPGRPIYVFDRAVVAHPECAPPPEMLRLGDFRETLPAFLAEGPRAILVHADIGSGDKDASLALAREIAPMLAALMLPEGCLVADQPMEADGLAPLPPLEGALPDRYYLYRRAS